MLEFYLQNLLVVFKIFLNVA